MKSYTYYWYHHMMPQKEQKIIFDAIQNKDYNKFIELYKKYSILAIQHGRYYDEFESWIPTIYLPDTISVYSNKDDIDELLIEEVSVLDKNNFMKITYTECECG